MGFCYIQETSFTFSRNELFWIWLQNNQKTEKSPNIIWPFAKTAAIEQSFSCPRDKNDVILKVFHIASGERQIEYEIIYLHGFFIQFDFDILWVYVLFGIDSISAYH